MCGVPSPEFPLLTAKNFEISLGSDDLLAHYFNDFLSLPSFPEGLLYNPETRLFEVATDGAELVSRRIGSVLRRSKSQLLTGGCADLCRSPVMDNRYAVTCLDREQGIQWIIRERLPLFLRSDCYSEYRLAKLFQQEFKVFIQRMKLRGRSALSASQMRYSSEANEGNVDTLRLLTCSKSAEDLSLGHGGSRKKDLSCLTSAHQEQNNAVNTGSSSSPELGALSFTDPDLSHEEAPEPRSLPTRPSVAGSEGHHGESGNHGYACCELQQACLVSSLDSRVFNNAGPVMDSWNHTSIPADVSRPAEQTRCSSAPGLCERGASAGCRETLGRGEGKVQEDTGGVRVQERTERLEARSGGPGQENATYNCSYGICCHGSRLGLDDFKEFLQGKPGEKTFNLWMDIERLKSAQNRERKNRHLAVMRGRYLLSSSRSCFPAALLAPLGLNTSPCWTEDRLRCVQPLLTDSLLHYWAPRFWMSQRVQGNFDDSPGESFLQDRPIFALSATEPRHGSLVCWDPTRPQPQLTTHTQLSGGRGPWRSSVEAMLEALSADCCAGSYFTTFCEQSGNQLWENAAHFWAELQNYRELFCQDGLDPYRVQREAQLLYSTYLLSSARSTIGIDERMSWEVHERMMPAFEELFDEVEEHALHVLLEPWTLLVHQDSKSFQKVCVWEDVRSVNSQEYQELQSLYEDSQLQLKQQLKRWESSVSPPPSSPEGPLLSDSWSSVPPSYRGYRLGSLFRHRHEISHFKYFLEVQDADVHLSCWLDLEQFRRTSQKEQWSHIANKYLNSNYFFGPESPATTQQQDDILGLAGGLERLKLESPSGPVVVQMQDIIRSRIEKTWLPHFLSTAEFAERQKHQPKVQAADGLSRRLHRRRRARRAAWKAEGLWMSSSKEILLFRRILLNPATCLQFQHFVYLKGGFLENDLLFWLEVQRYKDLCHSHSDEATVQQKISTIISCFISSSVPPALQIDIPPEQAQQILEKRRELGPYVFREAQMSVFNQLLKFWPEFQDLRKEIQEEQLLPLLQERRMRHTAQVRRRRRKEEEEEEEESRRAQEELKRPQSGYSEEEATGDEEARSEERQFKAQHSEVSPTPIKSLSWSYSKYMAALKKEEVLLKKQMEASFSTVSDSSSDYSVPSASSKASHMQSSWRTVDRKEDRVNRGARVRMK